MKRKAKTPPQEQFYADGTRPRGRINPKPNGFEVFGPDGGYLFKVDTLAEARKAILRNDRNAAA